MTRRTKQRLCRTLVIGFVLFFRVSFEPGDGSRVQSATLRQY